MIYKMHVLHTYFNVSILAMLYLFYRVRYTVKYLEKSERGIAHTERTIR